MVKLLELFGGIGACSKALERCRIDYEIADYVEIDKYAVKSYNAIHNTNFEPQDITKWNKDLKVDLIMHGSPCQDFSIAGNNAGGDKGSGTRSSLMYETIRIVEKLKPRVVIWENVKNLLSKKHKHNFDAYLEYMHNLGYENYYKVLNAKNYGIPQNRERIFTISIRGPHTPFIFPDEMPLELRLKDILEPVVDEKYYLSDKMLQYFERNTKKQEENGNGFRFKPSDGSGIAKAITTREGGRMDDNFIMEPKSLFGIYDEEGRKHQAGSVWSKDGLSPTLDTMGGGNRQPLVLVPEATKKGYAEAYEGDRTAGVPTVQRLEPKFDGTTNTITTVQKDNYVVESGLRVRKLTPLECWRLMGFDDEDFYKVEAVNSNTQLYKQAGNSIVVNVLCEILNNLREVLEMNKTSETTLTVFETDKFFDIAALAEKEPELFEELVKDYPVTNGVYQYKVG